jgi:ribosomal protein S18 acetylase RimI-like enzyme
MKTRSYSGEADLYLLQNFNSEAIAVTDHCGYLHPGDIPHHIYNGNKYYDPTELIKIWEDEQGVAAWILTQPRRKSFDAQVRPDLRGGEFEVEVLAYTEELLLELMKKHDVASENIYADAFQEDTARVQSLEKLGWEREGGLPYVLNKTKLQPIELPELPKGFSYRSATGIEDAAALADVHMGAFNSNWSPEEYQYVMESPGYDPQRELVIVAPDGSFAAFCIIWFDYLNWIGSFEPVGTHKEYHRRGFGRAVMQYGMQQMLDAGMVFATVAHFGNNEAAKGLYQGLGFKPWYLQDDYKKRIAT